MRARNRRLLALLGCCSFTIYGCASLISLDSLEKVSCAADCAGTGGAPPAVGGGDAGGAAAQAGAVAQGGGMTVQAGGSGGAAGAVAFGGAPAQGGALAFGGMLQAGASGIALGDAGAAGATSPNACPGGVTPVAMWKEHWFEHNQNLTRVYYDDCAAIYFDSDMPPVASTWLSPFISKAWAYSVQTYGYLGPERVYAIFHQNKYAGGHVAEFYDPSHDNHNVEDAGGTDWTQNYADITLTLLGFIIESNGAHTKYGSPAFALWGNSKWGEFYKYDLYLGLGLNDQAAAAFNSFSAASVDYPRTGTFWFRDWFYPLWRDHGHAQLMVNFYDLLEKYFPATDQQMGAMNWGEYVHFSSGAAHTNLKGLATKAFGWPAAWDAQFLKAQTDYPDITY